MPTQAHRVLYSSFRFAIRAVVTGQVQHLALASCYIDLFRKTDAGLPILILGKALTAEARQSLLDLPARPDKLEVWALPRYRALGPAIRVRMQITDREWSPLDLDAARDNIAFEWARGGIVEMAVDSIPVEEAPQDIQELCG